MEKKYLYFQPEYVGKFKCDGAKCNALCCKRDWAIVIDAETYKEYPPEVVEHIKFNSELKSYVMTLDENKTCPMLTEKKLCRLQLEHGEDFLSVTCATYPRHTYNLGRFFERSLTPTCPVAAELILFQEKPMAFEFVEVSEKIHSVGGKIQIGKFLIREDYLELVLKIQVAMISILQARRFSIDQRLIILGLFIDKLQELSSAQADKQTLLNLVATYQLEEFLAKEMPPLLQSFSGNAENFLLLIMRFIGYALPYLRTGEHQNFFGALEETLGINPKKNSVSVRELIPNYERLAIERNIFLENYSTFLENYLVNELFMNRYPFRFDKESVTKNFVIFLISYKIFELILFAATHKGFTSKEDLLSMVDWFTIIMDHAKDLHEKFFELLKGIDDIFLLMTCLLKG